MPDLKHANKRIVVKVDLEQKNGVTLEGGQEIRLIRGANNLDRAYTAQVCGEVVSAEGIPVGAYILFHFNAIHDVNKIFNYTELSGEVIASGVAYYSFAEFECFLWREKKCSTWNPIGGFILAERVFAPHIGAIVGVEPKQIKDTLWVTSGDLKGNVVHTLPASDFRLIFRDPETGKEVVLIRARHFPDDENAEREEIIAINHDLTEQVKSGKLLVGVVSNSAKPLENERIPAN